MNRIQSQRDPLLAIGTFEFDKSGNLTKHTERKSQITNVIYDGLNRPTVVTYADNSTNPL